MWPTTEHRRRSGHPSPPSFYSASILPRGQSPLTRLLHAGLSVHMNQVHKETLSHVENALPNRQGLDVEIFGVEGMPEDIRKQHEERIVKNFFDAQKERFEATGNPPPGEARPQKKIRIDTPEDLKKRFAEFRAKKAAAKAAGIPFTGVQTSAVPANVQSPAQPGVSITSLHLLPNHADHNPELPFRPSPALRPTRSARLPCLPTRRRSSPTRIQPIPRRLCAARPTTYPPDRTEPAPASRLCAWSGDAPLSSSRRRQCIKTRRRYRRTHSYGRGWHQAC